MTRHRIKRGLVTTIAYPIEDSWSDGRLYYGRDCASGELRWFGWQEMWFVTCHKDGRQEWSLKWPEYILFDKDDDWPRWYVRLWWRLRAVCKRGESK